MSRRALLILIGGRQVPNLLTVQHFKPDVIVPIASHESMREGDVWSRIKPILQQLSTVPILDPEPIDAFDPEQVRNAVSAAFAQHPDAVWVVNITCATTIMSIGAYETGLQKGASVWYLDTATRRVVTLNGQPPANDFYNLKVADYMAIYGRHPTAIGPEPAPNYVTFAKQLAQYPDMAMKWRDALRQGGANKGKEDQPRGASFPLFAPILIEWCEAAQAAGLLASYNTEPQGVVRCQLPHGQLWRFIDGDWLEVYAWTAARDVGCFDDYRYGLCIPGAYGRNELDLALTYSALLLIAECKTEDKPFDTAHLDKLRSIAGMIGGNFVGCVFITSQSPEPQNKNQYQAFESFCGQAKSRQIVVVTGDQLPNLSYILQRESGAHPTQRSTYSRG